MTTFLADPDVTLHHGDALEVLRSMPDESVDCVVTSPPYWGLRDYQTGLWAGGDPDCDHVQRMARVDSGRPATEVPRGKGGTMVPSGYSEPTNTPIRFSDVCGKCGATRQDQQMGLEPTPDLFVHRMVELFREVRRVLAPHGTCFVNLGDSYTSNPGSGQERGNLGGLSGADSPQYQETMRRAHSSADARPRSGLKPKDLVGIPWRVAFALQADGWYLRSDIIWAKPNPMPESVTDRPTKAHEYVFLLTKQTRYWFDAEAVRENNSVNPDWDYRSEKYRRDITQDEQKTEGDFRRPKSSGNGWSGFAPTGPHGTGRNVRSVWTIATQPYPEAHFATFPEELARRCIVAGCPVRVCRVCGRPSERIVERESSWDARKDAGATRGNVAFNGNVGAGTQRGVHGAEVSHDLGGGAVQTVGWSDCGHNNWRPGRVLDPFIGSGTVAKVARDHQRHAIGIDLNLTYLELAARRLQQLSLLST